MGIFGRIFGMEGDEAPDQDYAPTIRLADDDVIDAVVEPAPPESGRAASETTPAESDHDDDRSDDWSDEIARQNELLHDLLKRAESIADSGNDMARQLVGFEQRVQERYELRHVENWYSLACRLYVSGVRHAEWAQESGDTHYLDLVKNMDGYVRFIDHYLHTLDAALVVSAPGVPFDGEIHETTQDDFDPDAAEVESTLRPGLLFHGAVMHCAQVRVRHHQGPDTPGARMIRDDNGTNGMNPDDTERVN